jgi:AcrR family transcriptional regulator
VLPATVVTVARRGRPPGVDSADTRERIIDAARSEFAERGYAAASITSIATRADLAPSAIYHYFGGKSELYEAVFSATADVIWHRLHEDLDEHTTFTDAVNHLLDASMTFTPEENAYNDFLAMIPTESRLHPKFSHLLTARSKYQDAAFGGIVDLGLTTGELVDIDRDVAIEMARAAIMGSFFERHFRPELTKVSVRAVRQLLLSMTDGDRHHS